MLFHPNFSTEKKKRKFLLILFLFFNNYRKQLLDTESELQMLVRRLGAEASGILDSESGAMDRLTVPLLKKEGNYLFI